MRLPRLVGSLTLCAALAGCASVPGAPELTPIVPAGAPYFSDQNPVYIPLGTELYGRVFENVVEVLSDYGFTLVEANRYGGRLETKPRVAPGILLPLKPGSPDLYERCLATAQSYRHRVIVIIHPAEQGGYFIEVTAMKELEDLPRPMRSTVGAAIFRISNNVERTYEVIDPNVFEPNWLYKGRDTALEQEIIRRLKKLM